MRWLVVVLALWGGPATQGAAEDSDESDEGPPRVDPSPLMKAIEGRLKGWVLVEASREGEAASGTIVPRELAAAGRKEWARRGVALDFRSYPWAVAGDRLDGRVMDGRQMSWDEDGWYDGVRIYRWGGWEHVVLASGRTRLDVGMASVPREKVGPVAGAIVAEFKKDAMAREAREAERGASPAWAKGDVNPVSVYRPAEGLKEAVWWLRQAGANEVRVTWFERGRTDLVTKVRADLAKRELVREEEILPEDFVTRREEKLEKVERLWRAARASPESDRPAEVGDLVMVCAWEADGPRVRMYDRRALPGELSGAFAEAGLPLAAGAVTAERPDRLELSPAPVLRAIEGDVDGLVLADVTERDVRGDQDQAVEWGEAEAYYFASRERAARVAERADAGADVIVQARRYPAEAGAAEAFRTLAGEAGRGRIRVDGTVGRREDGSVFGRTGAYVVDVSAIRPAGRTAVGRMFDACVRRAR